MKCGLPVKNMRVIRIVDHPNESTAHVPTVRIDHWLRHVNDLRLQHELVTVTMVCYLMVAPFVQLMWSMHPSIDVCKRKDTNDKKRENRLVLFLEFC